MASIFTTALSGFYISTTSTAPATYDAAGYAALTYAKVCPAESIGPFGTTFEDVTFDDICTGLRQKIKGIQDNGTMELVFAYDDTDAGQAILRTAAADKSTADYAFKVTFPNKQNLTGIDAVHYFSGKVMTAQFAPGGASDVVKLNASVAITTPIVTVNSTAGV